MSFLQRPPLRTRALAAFALSVVTMVLGIILAARRFPGGFDWAYTVMSALASRKHNPRGAACFAAGLALSLAFLWPAVTWIGVRDGAAQGLARFGLRALRTGILLGILVGVERLLFFHLSQIVRKGHEVLALLCFLSLYVGVIALHAHRARRAVKSFWPACLAIAPLVGLGLGKLGLYLDRRDLGWVDSSWRELGVPVWRSFAFWQWLSVAAIGVSLGHLVASGRPVTAVARRPEPGAGAA